MRETRTTDVQQRVLTRLDIQRLATRFEAEYASLSKGIRADEAPLLRPNLTFTVDCRDGTTYTSGSSEIFADGGPLDTKAAATIAMELSAHGESRPTASLTIRHGKDYGNRLTVSGYDQGWVRRFHTEIVEVLGAATPQNRWLHSNYALPLIAVLALAYGYVILHVYALFSGAISPPAEQAAPSRLEHAIRLYPWLGYLTLALVSGFVGVLPALFTLEKLQGLWPSIEFDFGPEHGRLEKRRRKALAVVATLIILPILGNLLYDVLSSLLT